MGWTDPKYRTLRIAVMLSFVVLVGFSDLYMTKMYLVSFGLIEQNPLARLLFDLGSTSGITATKISSLSLVTLIVVGGRKHRAVEIGLLVLCVISMWVLVHWASYNNKIMAEFSNPHAPPFDGEPNWITASPILQTSPNHLRAPTPGDQSK